MHEKVRWGVLGAARIAVNKAIPGMQAGGWAEILAIASRDRTKAGKVSSSLGIPRVYGSYDELLADPRIEAIYNPLPNHLHMPWSIKAIEAGKHVLCEKPIGLNAEEAKSLKAVSDKRGVKIGEAFMVRTHPQWLRAREIVRSGRIGDIRSMYCFFSYTNRDPANVRNVPQYGGGALLDVGCYAVTMSRFIFGEEPYRVIALLERDPEMRIDRLDSGMMEFPSGQSIFTCSSQLAYQQSVQICGTKGRIEIEIPFTPLPNRESRIWVDDGRDLLGTGRSEEKFPPCNQFTIQGDLFSKAVRGVGDVPVPIDDAILNMTVIDALLRSVESGKWERP